MSILQWVIFDWSAAADDIYRANPHSRHGAACKSSKSWSGVGWKTAKRIFTGIPARLANDALSRIAKSIHRTQKNPGK